MNCRIFENRVSTASALADEIYRIIKERKVMINIAVSGGNTPGVLFDVLTEDFAGKINWNMVNLFWTDERCVPPTDPRSNYGMTRNRLLNRIGIPESNIFRIRGEDDPETEAVRYSEIIKQNVPVKGDFPSFDIILLGVGTDGHTASIFPGREDLLNTENICETVKRDQILPDRITLTGKIINNADHIFFFVCGKEKREIILKISSLDDPDLSDMDNSDKSILPAARIKGKHRSPVYYLDQDAASAL